VIKPAYLDRENAAAFVSLSVPTMERMVARSEFPVPRQLTGKRVGWLVRELEEWCENRPASTNLPVKNCGQRQAQAAGA
jgi:prophage regulatory protein